MARHLYRYCIGLLLAATLTSGAAYGEASSANVTINATVVEVQCTAEQRTRIRACAPAQENYTIEPRKRLVDATVHAGARGLLAPQFEIRLDPEHRVLIKTVLY